jgi:HEAT repeat protein
VWVAASETGALVQQLRSKDVEVRREAAKQLQGEDIDAGLAVPALITALKDKDRVVRRFSAIALGQLGVKNHTVIHALAARLNDEESSVATAALESLAKLGPGAFPTLKDVAKNPKMPDNMRVVAIGEIGTMNVDKKQKMSLFNDMLRSSAPAGYNPTAEAKPAGFSLRVQLVKSMAAADVDTAVTVPILSTMLVTDEDPDIRLEVIKALADMGRDAKPAVAQLNRIIDSTREQDMLCHDAAKEAVEKIEKKK